MAAAAGGDPGLVRNTCILAHVDHGKTTLADHLVAHGSGGALLKPSSAGRSLFMDHLPEERERAITIKSAAVALRHGAHRVHLIDSPGHLDFCSEASAAARLADSALVLVDAVDGVHVQTRAALRNAFAERLRPCLVLNKIDRLVTELRLTPEEAYSHDHESESLRWLRNQLLSKYNLKNVVSARELESKEPREALERRLRRLGMVQTWDPTWLRRSSTL